MFCLHLSVLLETFVNVCLCTKGEAAKFNVLNGDLIFNTFTRKTSKIFSNELIINRF